MRLAVLAIGCGGGRYVAFREGRHEDPGTLPTSAGPRRRGADGCQRLPDAHLSLCVVAWLAGVTGSGNRKYVGGSDCVRQGRLLGMKQTSEYVISISMILMDCNYQVF